MSGRPAVDRATVRRLLQASFTAEELRRFCQDSSSFAFVVDLFGPNSSLVQMVDVLVEQCGKKRLLGELLEEVSQANPRQYDRIVGSIEPSPDRTLSPSLPSSRRRVPVGLWPLAGGAVLLGIVLLFALPLLRGGVPQPTATTGAALAALPTSRPENTSTPSPISPTEAPSPGLTPTSTPSPTCTPSGTPSRTSTPATPSPTPPPPVSIHVTRIALYEDSASDFTWLSDSQRLLIQSSIVYDVKTGKTQRIGDHSWGQVILAPGGRLVAFAAVEGVTFLDVNGWGKIRTLAGTKNTGSLAFSPDGRILATGTGSVVKLWDVATGNELRTLPGSSGEAVAFSPESQILAAAGGVAGSDILLWDTSSGTQLPTLTGHTNWIRSLAFSPDGRLLASGSVDNTVRLWSMDERRQVRLLANHTGEVESVAFSPDGRLLASASWDLTVKLWDVTSGEELASLTGHTAWIEYVAFSPDGTMLATGSSSELLLWRVE